MGLNRAHLIGIPVQSRPRRLHPLRVRGLRVVAAAKLREGGGGAMDGQWEEPQHAGRRRRQPEPGKNLIKIPSYQEVFGSGASSSAAPPSYNPPPTTAASSSSSSSSFSQAFSFLKSTEFYSPPPPPPQTTTPRYSPLISLDFFLWRLASWFWVRFLPADRLRLAQLLRRQRTPFLWAIGR